MELYSGHCREVSQQGRIEPAQAEQEYLQLLDKAWLIDPEGRTLHREFSFKNYSEVMTFANFVAWMANRENHHPVMTLEYRRCRVEFTTHSAGGLSLNDFICAAKIDHYLESLA
jgi:4a-hydroxytetrahydrobiopterin dehydratase